MAPETGPSIPRGRWNEVECVFVGGDVPEPSVAQGQLQLPERGRNPSWVKTTSGRLELSVIFNGKQALRLLGPSGKPSTSTDTWQMGRWQ